MSDDIVVIGAGIIGVSTALALQKRGRQVRILDRKGVAQEASRGNAGAFAFADVVPLATPGIMRKAPKWLLDPLGPLSVSPAYALRALPWMVRFWRASWPDRYASSIAAQGQLMRLARAATDRQIADVDGERFIQRDGQLQLHEGAGELDAARPGLEARRAEGVDLSVLAGAGAIAEVQPGLSPRFTHAVLTPDWYNTTDPEGWTKHLAATFLARGGRVETRDVQALTPQEGRVSVRTERGTITARRVVVAAGAWSHQLARDLGDRIPLETERGYNTTLPPEALDLRLHLTFGGHGFVVSRTGGGIRVGGAVEFAGLQRAPNFRRSDALLAKAKEFLPQLDTRGGTQWMGFRPSLPDSLPVISRAPGERNVIYAFGHGHLGLTQSAGTAELVASLVLDGAAPIPMAPFAADRF